MQKKLSNKELVAAGHKFAANISADTPLIDMAKMVSELATQLDTALAAASEACKQRDTVTAESHIRCNIIGRMIGQYSAAGYHAVQNSMSPAQSLLYDALQALETPATEACLNAVRAEGIEVAANDLFEKTTVGHQMLMAFAAQLRAGNAGKDGGKKPISALPVERNQHGYWSHPDYLAFCDGREFIPNAEWEQWMSERGLHWHVEYRDEEELVPNVDGYDLSTWQPKAPVGEGWFVGSIHDTEDGAVCIWLRAGKDGV